jgi:hypothetical protein
MVGRPGPVSSSQQAPSPAIAIVRASVFPRTKDPEPLVKGPSVACKPTPAMVMRLATVKFREA